jgi:integrase
MRVTCASDNTLRVVKVEAFPEEAVCLRKVPGSFVGRFVRATERELLMLQGRGERIFHLSPEAQVLCQGQIGFFEKLRPVLPLWHPNQLRHSMATDLRREAGLDAARVVLGHRSPSMTEVYAEVDTNKAAEVMARLG